MEYYTEKFNISKPDNARRVESNLSFCLYQDALATEKDKTKIIRKSRGIGKWKSNLTHMHITLKIEKIERNILL